jgi:pimeloyl-ACP methyl ester carboxylesterase
MRKQAVIIGGACGHENFNAVAFWHKHAISELKNHGFAPVPVTYQGQSLEQCATSLSEQLEHCIDNGPVLALAYSMGGHILRLVADKHPEWFSQVIMLATFPHTGITVQGCWNFFSALPGPFIRGSIWPFTGQLKLTKRQQYQDFLFQGCDPATIPTMYEMLRTVDKSHFEPAWPLFQLGVPGFRKAAPPLRIKQVVAWIPTKDILCTHRSYPKEPQIITRTCENVGHGFVFSDKVMHQVIEESLAQFKSQT